MAAICVDLLIIIFIAMFLINTTVQLLSLIRLMNFLIKPKWARGIIYILLISLALLYMHDVFAMLFYYWGAPAYDMTVWSALSYEDQSVLVNEKCFCVINP